MHERPGEKFILRIEDTDLERSTENAIDGILERPQMGWGLDWDEGPNFQSRSLEAHLKAAEKMLKNRPCLQNASAPKKNWMPKGKKPESKKKDLPVWTGPARHFKP